MVDEDASSEDGQPASGERIVVTNGVDLDKRYFYESIKAVAWDWEIRRLSLIGPPLVLLVVLLMLFYFYLAVPTLPFGVPEANAIVETTTGFVSGSDFGALLVVFGGFALLLVVGPHLRAIQSDLLERGAALWRYLRSVGHLRHRSPWQNLNYWHAFTTHLSGRDPLVVLTETAETTVSGVYADSPHYGNVFVDAVYVRVRGEDLSWRQRVCQWVQDATRRKLRLAVLGTPVVLALFRSNEIALGNAGVEGILLSDGLFVASLVSAGALLTAAAPFLQFRTWFFVKTVRESGYSTLLDDSGILEPSGSDDRIRLSNSMFGYGLFYVSEFFYHLFGDQKYDVEVDVADLLDEERGDGFPTTAYGSPSSAEAIAAARELVWSALPASSVEAAADGIDDPDLSVEIVGVDYYTFGDEDDDAFRSARVGERGGFRLPVKKFMSVPHGTDRERVEKPPSPTPNLHRHDSWDEETTHHLLLGGGEHQQGLNKLFLALKAQGYTGVDVLENAFAGQVDETVPDDGPYPFVLFPTEYFVAFAGGNADFFRHEDDAFALFRHRVEEDEWVHVLMGTGAAGTKLGFLYWLDQYDRGFEDVPPDEFQFLTHPSVDGVDGLDDVGDLYMDTSWRGSDALTFTRHERDVTDGAVSPPEIDLAYYDLDVTYDA